MKLKDWEIHVRHANIDWKTERERIDLAAVVTGLLGPGPRPPRRGAAPPLVALSVPSGSQSIVRCGPRQAVLALLRVQ